MFDWSQITTIKMATIALAAISLTLSAIVLKKSSAWQASAYQSIMAGIAGMLLLTPDSWVTFAQREHWVVILVMPYVLLRLPSVERQSVSSIARIIIGIFSGIGFCIKPHFFAIWVAILAYEIWHKRSLRMLIGIQEVTIVATGILYAAAICIFAPQYFAWVHMISAVYANHGNLAQTYTGKALWFVGVAIVSLAVAKVMGLLKITSDLKHKQDTIYLIWVAIGAYLEALLQFKTWGYILYPLTTFGMLAIITIIALQTIKESSIWAFVAMTWLFFPVTPLSDSRQDIRHVVETRFQQAVGPSIQGKKAYFISLYQTPRIESSGPILWPPVNYYNVLLQSIMTQSKVTSQPTLTLQNGQEWLNRWTLDITANDLTKRNPDVLIIDREWDTVEAPAEFFDFTQWFATDQRMSSIMNQYAFEKEVEICANLDSHNKTKRCSYRIYNRK